MLRSLRLGSLGLALLLAVAAPAGAQAPTPGNPPPAPPDDPALDALLAKGVARGYPGVALRAVAADGSVRTAAAGFSDLVLKRPLESGDAFHIGSISKAITAVATLALVDRGLLALDAPIGSILGDAVTHIPHSGRITVGQLLDHSSGIYPTNNDLDYLATMLGPKADPLRAWTPAELVALADGLRQKPVAEPGAGHHYSDSNYTLLGMIVEKVAAKPFKRHVAETLFAPLGMSSTWFYSDHLGADARPPVPMVRGYLLATAEIRSILDIHPMFRAVPGAERPEGALLDTTLASERLDAAGGVVSTLPDLARFAEALFHGRLLQPASQRFLTAALDGIDREPVGTERVRALQASHKPYGAVLFKEGDGPGGASAVMVYLPARDAIYIGFANSFGHFDEVDFLLDEVVAGLVASD